MKPDRAAKPLLAWGSYLAVLAALESPFNPRPLQVLVLAAAAALVLSAGGVLHLLERHHRSAAGEIVADSSFASATVAAGLSVVLIGASFGLWLIFIGTGITAAGIGGIVRESRARRRLQKRSRGALP